jgi:hypothetical protein
MNFLLKAMLSAFFLLFLSAACAEEKLVIDVNNKKILLGDYQVERVDDVSLIALKFPSVESNVFCRKRVVYIEQDGGKAMAQDRIVWQYQLSNSPGKFGCAEKNIARTVQFEPITNTDIKLVDQFVVDLVSLINGGGTSKRAKLVDEKNKLACLQKSRDWLLVSMSDATKASGTNQLISQVALQAKINDADKNKSCSGKNIYLIGELDQLKETYVIKVMTTAAIPW